MRTQNWGAPPGRTGSRAAKAGTSNAVRAAAGRPAGRAGQQPHLARSAQSNERSKASRHSRCPGRGARHNRPLPEPAGRAAVGAQSEALRSDWPTLGNARLCSIACDLPRPGGVTIAQRAQNRHHPGVAAGAVGGFIADGAVGGQHVTKPAKSKSQRRRRPKEVQSKAVARETKP